MKNKLTMFVLLLAVGQLVKTLSNNEFVYTGTKEITFDAFGEAGEIYFKSVNPGILGIENKCY